ncbi:MAG: NB-ARC domain-containing protein, partial [Actinomycetes bacterium]
ELSELDDLLNGPAPVLVSAIAGTAGVGKTALAVHWAHRKRDRFPDGQLYIDLRGFGPGSPMPPEDALAEFLRELGVDGTTIPAELDARAARFRSLVAGRRMLIVLDNARTADQVRPLLPGDSTCLALVTSRDSLAGLVARDGAQRILLDRLTIPDARALLRELLGEARTDAEPSAIDLLIERCARLPLALRIAAELIGSRPHQPTSAVVDDLDDERTRLETLDAGGDPHTAIRAVFSWSYRALPPDAARLFRLLGTFPGHHIDIYALAALAGSRPDEVRQLIDVLLRAHLVDETSSNRYQTHDLLRAFAAELAARADPDAERGGALDRVFDHFLHTAWVAATARGDDQFAPLPEPPAVGSAEPAFASATTAIHWLDTERANLVNVATYAARHGRPDAAMRLASTTSRYLR